MRLLRLGAGYIGATALIALAASAISAAPTQPLPRSVSDVTPDPERMIFRFDDGNRMTIPVQLNGGSTLNFMIDTGAERTGISAERAMQLGLASVGQRSVIDFAGRKLVPTVRIPSLRFGQSRQIDIEALTFAESDIGADGFLGIDTLDRHRVVFDFMDGAMELRRAPRLGLRNTLDAVVVDFFERRNRLIFSDARIERARADVILDTGSSVTIGNGALREYLRLKGRLGRTSPIYIQTITGEIVSADYGILREVTIGDVLIRRLPIAFASTELFEQLELTRRPALLLGMDALRVFAKVTVDFRDRSVGFVGRKFDPTYPSIRFEGSRF